MEEINRQFMTEPIDQSTKDLIEKEARKYVMEEDGYQVLPGHFNWIKAHIAGATVWAEKLQQERNKYDDLFNSIQRHFQTLIARNYNNIGVWSNERQDYNYQLISELEELLKNHSLKDKSHE